MSPRQTKMSKATFLNFTDLPDDQARSIVGKLRDRVEEGEMDRDVEVARAEDAIRIWKNDFWTDEDKKFFEEKFNVTPYEFPAARAPLNRLVSQQSMSRYDFQLLPMDQHSAERYRKGRDAFVEKNYQDFDTPEQAREHYDRYYDDELAQAVTIQYQNLRTKNSIKYIESQCFENGVITGADFLKTTYSKRNNPDGEIVTERKSVRQMIWDHSSVSPVLNDVEYIGEVHRLYRADLVAMFPDQKEAIEKAFAEYSNFVSGMNYPSRSSSWSDYYDFDNDMHDVRAKVAELWYEDIEERLQLVYLDTGKTRLISYGKTEEDVTETLATQELEDMEQMMKRGELDPQFFNRPEEEIMADIDEVIQQKYDVKRTQTKVWYKALFSHDALFEFKRQPLPHNSHPYTPFFAQFTEGWYTGVIDDIKDILIAYQKAIMFREIMLANSAKGLLFIDRGTANKSGYTVDDIREMWTEVGGVIDLDLRGGRRLQDVFQQVTNVADGLFEIRSVISELEQKIYTILGINDAMLGFVGNEASGSQVRQRIQQGSANNGVMFDNFNRTLETHTKNKVIPMVVAEMMVKQPQNIRGLADSREQWVELAYDEDFELFADAILSGDFQMKLITKQVDKQIEQQWSAMLIELAQTRPDAISLEAVLEHTEMPDKAQFLQRNRELMKRTERDAAMRQLDLQQLQQIMASAGLDEDTASKIMKEGRKQALQQYEDSKNKVQQAGQGGATTKTLSSELSRQSRIEESNNIQNG